MPSAAKLAEVGTIDMATESPEEEDPPEGVVVVEVEAAVPPHATRMLRPTSKQKESITALLLTGLNDMYETRYFELFSRYRPVRQITMGQRPVVRKGMTLVVSRSHSAWKVEAGA